MIEREDKLAKFFAKQDKKIQKNGYKTINEIAEKKHSKIQSVKQGANIKKPLEDSNKSDEEWEQIDSIDISSNIGYLPDHTDLSLSKLIDQKKIQQQKILEQQHKSLNDNLVVEPVISIKTPKENIISPVVEHQPQSEPQIIKEDKPKIYRPGSRFKKDPLINVNLGLLLQDESEFPTL